MRKMQTAQTPIRSAAYPRCTRYHHPQHTQQCRLFRPTTNRRISFQPCRSHAEATRSFLQWIDANGALNVAGNTGKIAIFEDDSGERGVLCCENISKGEPILHLPLRLAVKDYAATEGDAQENKPPYEGAAWSVRLAAKLLRMKAEGEANPWHPYLQVLPKLVPSPLTNFNWDDMQLVEYNYMKDQLYAADYLASDAFKNCEPDTIGGHSEDDFRWALSVVHSRTFGVAAEGGGIGVRMLVPLVDMLNHAGDQTPGLLTQPPSQLDNVRWEVMGPEKSKTGEWEMMLYASRDIEANEQVLLSYGERNNDDFFLHYGFVPLCNPHDDVVLFPNLEEALNWHNDKFPMEGSDTAIYSIYENAYQAALQELLQSQRNKPPTSGSLALQQEDTDLDTKLKIVAGNRVESALIIAFAGVADGNLQHAEAAVAIRCWDLLRDWNPLVCDLAALTYTLRKQGTGALYQYLLQHYYMVTCQAGLDPLHGKRAPSPGEASQGTPGTQEGGSTVVPNGQDVNALLQYLIPHGALPAELTSSQRLAVEYRVYKKMILWDLILEKKDVKFS